MIFKRNKIAILRKKLKDEKWLIRKQNYLLSESYSLHRFSKFECSEFFEGKRRAEHNLKKYSKQKFKNDKHLDFIESHLNALGKG